MEPIDLVEVEKGHWGTRAERTDKLDRDANRHWRRARLFYIGMLAIPIILPLMNWLFESLR